MNFVCVFIAMVLKVWLISMPDGWHEQYMTISDFSFIGDLMIHVSP